jgi:hypothetical protein
MLHPSPEAFAATHPASLWTADVKVRFLDRLAHTGNVRLACRQIGLSAETAYRERRRDPVFARAWAAAMVLARDVVNDMLHDIAIDGIEEEVWYRGELHGTRRRFDTRLFLARVAQLNTIATPEGEDDATRFDELLAVIAGEELPEGIEVDEDPLPLDGETLALIAADDAECDVKDRWEALLGARKPTDEEARLRAAECLEARKDASKQATVQWEEWIARVHTRVDAVTARTLSTVSTPALASALAGDPASTPTDGASRPT